MNGGIYLKRKIRYLPILFLEIYLTLTMYLLLFGPWNFELHNSFYTIVLLLLYQISLMIGYLMTINTYVPKATQISFDIRIEQIVMFVSILNIALLLLNLIRSLGLSGLTGIISRIVFGLSNPGAAYNMKFDVTSSNVFLGKIGTLIFVIASPISYSVIPLNMIFFKKLPRRGKCIALCNIILSSLIYVSTGTNKGIFDIVICLAVVLAVSKFKKYNDEIDNLRNASKKMRKMFISVCLLGIFALLTFNKMLSSRGMGTQWISSGYAVGGVAMLRRDSFWVQRLPYGLSRFFAMLSSYLCQGYYAFSLSTEIEWIPMFGLGSNKWVLDQLYESNVGLIENTFQYRIEQLFGWNRDVQWHSLYTWLANDYGHLGVIFVMFLLGAALAATYKESIINGSTISKLMLCYLFIILIYIPANNQIFQTMESMASFIVVFFIWLFFRGKQLKLYFGELSAGQ